MTKKAFLLVLVFCLLLSLFSPTLVQAQSSLKVLASSAQVEFPAKLNFNLSAESSVNITDIRLHYSVEQEGFAEVTSEVYIEFAPGNKVDISWALEMVKVGGLPSGSNLEYWWTIEDASGNRVETAPVAVQFADNRYSWRNLTEGKVTLYWYKGDDACAQELMAAAQQALARLAEDTGAELQKQASIYIYASSRDLQGALIFPPGEWTGGVAYPRFGIIAIGIAPEDLSWGKRAIAHELSHLIIGQVTLNPYGGLPVWLDEGLAMYAEGPLEMQFTTYLTKAVTENSLISVQSLSSPFSAFTNEAILAYAESFSLVQFLIRNYGQDKMLELLHTFREGSGYDAAFLEVYGFDMDGLDALWRDYLVELFQLPKATVWTHPALMGTTAAVATALLLWLGLAVEERTWSRNR